MKFAGQILIGLAFFWATPSSHAADVGFVRVWPGWRDSDYFDRIGHFFGWPGSLAPGREIVVRTDGAVHEGYYFLVRLKSPDAIGAAKFEVSVIRPDTLQPVTTEFPVNIPAKETVFQLGLTGAAWPEGKKAHPVAWKLALKAADGHVLAEQKSFLWEKPPK